MIAIAIIQSQIKGICYMFKLSELITVDRLVTFCKPKFWSFSYSVMPLLPVHY